MYNKTQIDQFILSLAEKGLEEANNGPGIMADQLRLVKERIGKLRQAVDTSEVDGETHGTKSLAKFSTLTKPSYEIDGPWNAPLNQPLSECPVKVFDRQLTVKKPQSSRTNEFQNDKETVKEPPRVRGRFYSSNSEEDPQTNLRLKQTSLGKGFVASEAGLQVPKQGGLNKLDEHRSLKNLNSKPPVKNSPRLLRGQSGSLPKPVKVEKSKDVVEIAKCALNSDVLLKMMRTPSKLPLCSTNSTVTPVKPSLLSSGKKEGGSARKSSQGSEAETEEGVTASKKLIPITSSLGERGSQISQTGPTALNTRPLTSNKHKQILQSSSPSKELGCFGTPSFPLQPTTPKALKGREKPNGHKDYTNGVLPSPVTESPSDTQSNFFDASMQALSKAMFRD